MVKKKAAKKAAKKKAAPKRAAKVVKGGFNGAARRARAAKTNGKPRRKSPEQQELIPGVRYEDLDRFCRNIGDNRDEVNQMKGEGKSLETGALKAMRIRGVTMYKGSGVLLIRVAGDETLTVKRDRSGAADGGQTANGNGAETGSGQDPEHIGEALTEGGDDGDELTD